jgi:hypothetical protein
LRTNFGTKFWADLNPAEFLWQLAVESPVRELIDGWCIRVGRMMSDAECKAAKCKAIAVADEAEDHPELAVWSRQIDLEAGWEFRAVTTFGITSAQSLYLDAILFEAAASLAQRLGSSTAASHRVLGESTLVEEDTGMTPPDWQELPLAVCGLERPVLCL